VRHRKSRAVSRERGRRRRREVGGGGGALRGLDEVEQAVRGSRGEVVEVEHVLVAIFRGQRVLEHPEEGGTEVRRSGAMARVTDDGGAGVWPTQWIRWSARDETRSAIPARAKSGATYKKWPPMREGDRGGVRDRR
jgi:hypothetical protein